MTEREKFEAWFKSQDSGASGFEIWQASRRAALEEAATRLDEYQKDVWQHNYWECAANIVRSLTDGADHAN